MSKYRPPRIFQDENGKYYIKQDGVDRYFQQQDFSKIKSSIIGGKLNLSTKRKSDRWKKVFIKMPIIDYQHWRNVEYQNKIQKDEFERAKRDEKEKQDKYDRTQKEIADIEKKYDDLLAELLANRAQLIENRNKRIAELDRDRSLAPTVDKQNEITREAIRVDEEFNKENNKSLLEEQRIRQDRVDEVNKIKSESEIKLPESKIEEKEEVKTLMRFLDQFSVSELFDIWVKYDLTTRMRFYDPTKYNDKIKMIDTIIADKSVQKLASAALAKALQTSLRTKKPLDKEIFVQEYKDLIKKGSGKKKMSEEGLYSNEIVDMLSIYDGFLGVICNDQMDTMIEPSLHYDKFGFVINTDNSDGPGIHWVALYFDLIAGEVDYYDSFAGDPSKEVQIGIKDIIDAHDINYYLKFKINKIVEQDMRTSNCGFFAVKFLIDRFDGKPFKYATGFSNTRTGENKIKILKKTFGYI